MFPLDFFLSVWLTQESVPYLSAVSESLLQYVTSEDFELRELASYVIGLAALHAGASVKDMCKAVGSVVFAV